MARKAKKAIAKGIEAGRCCAAKTEKRLQGPSDAHNRGKLPTHIRGT